MTDLSDRVLYHYLFFFLPQYVHYIQISISDFIDEQ